MMKGWQQMHELVEETLDSCREYTPKLIQVSLQMIDFLQTGKDQEGLELLKHIFDGLQWLLEAVQGIQKNGVSINIDTESITNHFRELEGALEIQDYTLVSDLFAYEIVPSLNTWLKKINDYQIQ